MCIYNHLYIAIASFVICSLVISPLTQRSEICLTLSGKGTPSILFIAFAILTTLRRFSLVLSSIEIAFFSKSYCTQICQICQISQEIMISILLDFLVLLWYMFVLRKVA